ncbi:Ulp1-like peptidase [Cucumis melo var. makuwa]|uniref:Ulp1-like peptidase n=1 Tax=Cucumis melo var. makuwa TaxID=1194695 RepID=A0A5D3DX98_CUCMM|nr:Ulp1-like peptidase [Cucumis melo var. makuwa]
MLIIKVVIEMTPEEEQLKIASGELFENLRSSTIGDEEDRKGFEGLVDHTLESEEVDNAKTEDVNTGGTSNWLRMPKEDDTSNGAKHIELKKKGDEDVHIIGTPPWLRFNIEFEKPIDVLEKKVELDLEEPIDVVDNEVEIEDSGKKYRTHFDSDVTEIEPFPTQRQHVRPAHRKRASVYLSIPFTTLPKRFRAWITDKRTNDKHLDALFLFIRFKIKAGMIPFAQNFTTADTIFMRLLVAKWPQYKECIKENRPFDWKKEYRLVDYVVGSKEDFQDPWASVDYVYSPFNIHANHWVLLCLDLVSCQVKV